jgi:hypothetical protein
MKRVLNSLSHSGICKINERKRGGKVLERYILEVPAEEDEAMLVLE